MSARTAFITGASQGLGAALAQSFIAHGYNVAMADIAPALAETARALDPSGARSLNHQLDVRDEAAFQAAFNATVTRFGAVDVMINNAARTISRSLWDISGEEWDDVLQINLRGVFFGSRIAGLHMRERRSGRIINMTSIAGQVASPATGAHYAASKAGIVSVTRLFAHELAPFGVTVNAVAPSAIMSPAVAAAPAEKIAAVRASIPMGRLGEPDEVSAAALFLASDGAAYMTGATLDVNGGRLMR